MDSASPSKQSQLGDSHRNLVNLVLEQQQNQIEEVENNKESNLVKKDLVDRNEQVKRISLLVESNVLANEEENLEFGDQCFFQQASGERFRNVKVDDLSDDLINKQTTSDEHPINEQLINDRILLVHAAKQQQSSTNDLCSNANGNLINQIDKLVHLSQPSEQNEQRFQVNSTANSFHHPTHHTTALSSSNVENHSLNCEVKRRHCAQSNYNTFNAVFDQQSTDNNLINSAQKTNGQQSIWKRLANKFTKSTYEKIDESEDQFNDQLSDIDRLNQLNNQKNHQFNYQNIHNQENSKFIYQNLDKDSSLSSSSSSNTSLDSSSITNFFQSVISAQRNMTASSALDLPSDQQKFKPSISRSNSYVSSNGIQLKQNLGLLNGVCIIVGVIVGSGIFISPKGVLETSHSVGLSLSIWICCGFLSLIGALCYAELGTAIPKSGGDYAYIREAFGDLPAFLFLWVATLIIMPTGNAIAALTFANYVLVPYYRFSGCGDPPESAVQLIAIILVCFLTFINCYNVKCAAFLMDAFTFAKIFALTIIIAVGVWQISKGSTHNFERMFDGSSTSPQQIALSFYSGLFSYAGWNFLNFITEELKDPFKTLPRAIYISLPLVTVIYVLANIAYFTVLSPAEIVDSNAVAITFGDRVLGFFSWTMPVFVVLSTFGGLNGSIMTSSRLFFVGARHGHLPRVLGQVSIHYVTPVPSLLFMCLTTLVYLSTANVYLLINYTAFNESLFITLSVAGLLWLRYKQPNLERPIKVNICLPIFFFVVCTFLVLLPVFEKPKETGISALITLTGIPVYLVTIAWKNKPALYNKINDSVTRFLQVLLITIEEKRS